MTNTQTDFVLGIELLVQDLDGIEIATLGAYALSDATKQRIMADVEDYMTMDDEETYK